MDFGYFGNKGMGAAMPQLRKYDKNWIMQTILQYLVRSDSLWRFKLHASTVSFVNLIQDWSDAKRNWSKVKSVHSCVIYLYPKLLLRFMKSVKCDAFRLLNVLLFIEHGLEIKIILGTLIIKLRIHRYYIHGASA